MIIRVAINGYGRIGRNILRAHYEGGKKHDLQFVAINDLGNAQTNAHLTRYDTTHGKFPGTIAVEGESMVVNGDRIQVCAKRNPAELPWKDLKVDAVLECTGLFTSKEKASSHLAAGAKKEVKWAPGEKDVDSTSVVGVNDKTLKASDTVISNGSCTTNCLAPLVKAVSEAFSVLSFTPTTMVRSTSFSPGAEITTFFAPAARCDEAFSLLVKSPVHSSTASTFRSFQGSSAGLRFAHTWMRSPFTTIDSPSTAIVPGNFPCVVS